MGIRFSTFFGEKNEHMFEFTGYGTVKYFERVSRSFKIINRNGLGLSAHYTGKFSLFGAADEFTAGVDGFYQAGPIEEYRNIGGTKGDLLERITSEGIGNMGVFLQNIFTIVPDRLDVMATIRYDNMALSADNRLFDVRSSQRQFNRATPKAAMNYKITPHMSAYVSYGLSFDTPADNEMDNYPTSSNPTPLLNPDLRPQKSKNLEGGIKGSAESINFELSLFSITTEDEIVPFDLIAFSTHYYHAPSGGAV